jgi:hypothetical protein
VGHLLRWEDDGTSSYRVLNLGEVAHRHEMFDKVE